MTLVKIILNLMINKAPLNQYYLNLGAHLLKKGSGFYIGQIVKEKKINPGIYRVKVITGLFYDFNTNKVNHTADNRIMKINEEKR